MSSLTLSSVLDRWSLQDAKARFSELVRRSQSNGPQHVTLHGRDTVVVVDAAQFRSLSGARSGQALIDAMQAAPRYEVDLEPDLSPARHPMPVRGVVL